MWKCKRDIGGHYKGAFRGKAVEFTSKTLRYPATSFRFCSGIALWPAVDFKAERTAGRLLALGAYLEPWPWCGARAILSGDPAAVLGVGSDSLDRKMPHSIGL
jgi:hypothetical protein